MIGFLTRRGLIRSAPARFRPQIEALEDRQLPSITSLTQVAQMFPRHSGPTTLYLNFDGYANQGVSAFQSTSGNFSQDVHDIMYRASEIFAPFDVQVRRIFGDGSMDTSSNGNTTIFIGDKSGNGTGANNGAYAYTPFANSDFPGPNRGDHHQPNSDAYDIAFVDPISAGGVSWSNKQIARAIGHEGGHTFGLAHVLSSPDQEIMSYDATNVKFVNKTFDITDLNYNGTSTVHDSRLTAQWYETHHILFFSYDTTIPITQQNSYTYLQAALGDRSNFGDAWANVADTSAVDPTYVNGFMPSITLNSSSILAKYSTTGGVDYNSDYDVFKLSMPTSRWVNIDVKQYSSSLDSVVMVYNSTGQTLLAFNDDSSGSLNSYLHFYCTAGVSYRIVVGSYANSSTGNYQLTVGNSIRLISPILTAKPIFVTASLSAASQPGGSGAGAGAAGLSMTALGTRGLSLGHADAWLADLFHRPSAKDSLDHVFAHDLPLAIDDCIDAC